MKITVLSYDSGSMYGTAVVRFTPNRFERLLGYEPYTKEYKWEGGTYTFGGERKWYDKETGKVYGRFEAIDDFIRKQRYNAPSPKPITVEGVRLYDAFYGFGESIQKLGAEIQKKKIQVKKES